MHFEDIFTLIEITDKGIIVKRDIAGEFLYLQWERGKEYFDYVPDNEVELFTGNEYHITFSLGSMKWIKEGNIRYFTNALLISLELS